MGQLREQSIPTVFQGVSRQPDSVRFPGQVQDAENVDFSVETGGFSKRLGSRILKKLTGVPTDQELGFHLINRDANEKYAVVYWPQNIKVYDLSDLSEKTVNIAAGGTTFLDQPPSEFAYLTAVDFTFIANRTLTVAQSAPVIQGNDRFGVVAVKQANIDGSWTVTVNYGVAQSFSGSFTTSPDGSPETNEVASFLRSSLDSNKPSADWTIERDGSFILIKNDIGTDFTISTEAPLFDSSMGVTVDQVQDTLDLPLKAWHDQVVKISQATDLDGVYVRFDADDGTSGTGVWRETYPWGSSINFDQDTMPWALVRNADTTFTFDKLDWSDKVAGDDEAAPPPDFVGEQIEDLIFHRNRFGVIAGETVYFSQAGDYFNFWPDTVTDTLDSDPFGLTNTTSSISKFYFGVPFRRSIFVMADNAQFEVGGDLLTPTRAVIDLATSYASSTVARPVAVGDELYMVVDTGESSTLLSYVYNESTVSETANDVTKHVKGFVPSPVMELAGEPISGRVDLLSSTTQSALYTHKFYYQGNERVQSAWGRSSFPDTTIRSIKYLDGKLFMLVVYDGAAYLECVPTLEDAYQNYDWAPRIDHQQELTGSYDGVADETTWDLGYTPTDPVAITTNLFPDGSRMLSLPLTTVGTTVTASGDWSANPVLLGENFDAFVTLSKQYVRNEENASIINGRLQLRNMTVRFNDTGYFVVEVIPEGRSAIQRTYTGRVLGSSDNEIQMFNIANGKFRFGVKSNGETATITVRSDKFLPFTITSAAWIGFFNEVSRQG